MPWKSIHWRAVKDYPSFPNNRHSTRFPRRRTVTRRVWKEDDFTLSARVPDTALFTPFDIPNPLDNAPTLVSHHAIHYSDAGGYGPANPLPGFGPPDPGEPWLQCRPLSPDTDGDSANDGQEFFGYDLVWMSIGAGGTVTQHDVKGVKSDPVDGTNAWRDLDQDGISDWAESTANTTGMTDPNHPLFSFGKHYPSSPHLVQRKC
jgi:hypothetical protein